MQTLFTQCSAILPHLFGLILVLLTGGALFLSMKCFDRIAAHREDKAPGASLNRTSEVSF